MKKLNKIILTSALSLTTLLSFSNIKVNAADVKVNTKPTIEEHLMKNWDARNPKIDVKDYNLTWDDFNSIIYDIHTKRPEYYYAFRDRGPIDEDNDGKVDYIIHDYLLDRRDELEVEFQRVKEQAKYATSDLEKALVVHDWLCDTITYSQMMSNSSHDIEGAILEKTAVCEGYALAYQYYMNRFGIPCKKVSGMSNSQPHAWNQIMIDGEWYMVDATWDDTREPKVTKHNNFLVSGEKLAYGGGDPQNKHTWDHQAFEACTSKKYDNMFWDNFPIRANYTIRTYNGKLYYKGYSKDLITQGIFYYDLNKDTIGEPGTLFVDVPIDERWPMKNGEIVDFTQMDIYNDELYYSKPTSIWKKSLINDSAPVKVYDAAPNTYIWDVEVEYGRLYFDESLDKEGVREFKSIKIDEYRKQVQPLAVSHETVDLYLGSDISTIQAAAPSKVTYTSDDSTIVEVKPVWADASASLTPKNVGTTTVRVKVDECDGYLANEKLITVNVKKSSVELYSPKIDFKKIGNEINITGNLYLHKINSSNVYPTGKININVLGDGVKLLANDIVVDVPIDYYQMDIKVSDKYKNYKLLINYSGDNNFDSVKLTQEYNNVNTEIPHTHTYQEPKYYWNNDNTKLTATFYCNGCSHKEDVTVNTSVIEKVDPLCLIDGYVIYEGVLTFNGQEFRKTNKVYIPKLNHKYNVVKHEFNTDYTNVSVLFKCEHCNHEVLKTGDVVQDGPTKNPTCTEVGAVNYKAVVELDGKYYTFDETRLLEPIGHNYINGVCTNCNKKDQSFSNNRIVMIIVTSLSVGLVLFITTPFVIKYIKKKKNKE